MFIKMPSFWPSNYEIANVPDNWRNNAYGFKIAVEVLTRDHKDAGRSLHQSVGQELTAELMGSFKASKVQLPSIVLMGYAIENLLKGLLVKKKKCKANERISFGNHNLGNFFKDLEIELDEKEEEFVSVLENAIKSGKYPADLFPSDKKEMDSTSARINRSQQELFDDFNKLYRKLDDLF
jgi:hypothetical protein